MLNLRFCFYNARRLPQKMGQIFSLDLLTRGDSCQTMKEGFFFGKYCVSALIFASHLINLITRNRSKLHVKKSCTFQAIMTFSINWQVNTSELTKPLSAYQIKCQESISHIFNGFIGARRGSRIFGPMPGNFTAIETFSPLPKVCVISPTPKLA